MTHPPMTPRSITVDHHVTPTVARLDPVPGPGVDPWDGPTHPGMWPTTLTISVTLTTPDLPTSVTLRGAPTTGSWEDVATRKWATHPPHHGWVPRLDPRPVTEAPTWVRHAVHTALAAARALVAATPCPTGSICGTWPHCDCPGGTT